MTIANSVVSHGTSSNIDNIFPLSKLTLNESLSQAITLLLQSFSCHLGVTKAGISVFDSNRAHLKITIGYENITTHRSNVICDRVFNLASPIACSDISQSSDLKSFPFVNTSGMRFYYGLPLFDANSKVFGVICAWEKTPLPLPEHNTENELLRLSSTISLLILNELKRTNEYKKIQQWHSYYEAETLLHDIKGDATVLIDESMRIQHATDSFYRLLGRRADELIGLRLDSFVQNCAPLNFCECLSQATCNSRPLQALLMLRGKGHRSHIKLAKIFKQAPSEGQPLHSMFAIELVDNPGALRNRPHAAFRRQLIAAMRFDLSEEERLTHVINLVTCQIKGEDNIAIVSIATGPNSRKILYQQRDTPFIEDLRRHHDFTPDLSICATTFITNRYLSCKDTLTEHRWPNYDWLYYTHGIRSVWCMPIPSDEGLPIGLLTVFRKEPGSPDALDLETLEESSEWAATLLLNTSIHDQHEDSTNAQTSILNKFEQHIQSALSNIGGNTHHFILGLNAKSLLDQGVSESYIQELISLHFDEPGTLFKIREYLWCWHISFNQMHSIEGTVDKINASLHQKTISPSMTNNERLSSRT